MLEQMENVLHVGRPVQAQAESTIGMFKAFIFVERTSPVNLERSIATGK